MVPEQPSSGMKFALTLPTRTRIEKDLAEELFAPLAAERYEAVEISGHCVSPAAAQVAAAALTSLAKKRCLRTFNISDCIAGLDNNGAVAVLSALCNAVGKHWGGLRHVDLSSNALGSRGVAACAAVIRDQPGLEELYLSNNGLAAATTKLLRMHLCASAGKATKLRVFHCTLNCVESEGMRDIIEIIKASPALEHLRLSSLRAQSDSTLLLCHALANTANLKLLDVSDNGFNEECAVALAAALEKQASLEALHIRDLGYDIDALERVLSPLVASGAPLNTLDISGNEVTAECGSLIVQLFSSFGATLRCLYMGDAELGGNGVAALAEHVAQMQPPALRTLSVSGNNCRDHQALELAAAVLKLPQPFMELDVDDNCISEDTVGVLRKYLGSALGSTDKMQPEDEWDDPEDEEELYGEDDVAAAVERLVEAALARGPLPEPEEEQPLLVTVDSDDTAAVGGPLLSEVTSASADTVTASAAAPAPVPAPTPPAEARTNDEATTSARKLNNDLMEIRGVLTDFVQDLNSVPEPSASIPRRLFDDPAEEDEPPLDESDLKPRSVLADAVSGLFVSVFLVIMVLGVAQSNEEYYSYRPI